MYVSCNEAITEVGEVSRVLKGKPKTTDEMILHVLTVIEWLRHGMDGGMYVTYIPLPLR